MPRDVTANGSSERYIHVVGWEKHQHPDAARSSSPPWIKNFTALLDNPAYQDLTLAQRGVLHGLWLLYARTRREIRGDTAGLTRQLSQRVTSAQLEALNHAGFIVFSASKVASTPASTEVEERRGREETPSYSPKIEVAFSVLAAIGKPGYSAEKFTRERFARLAENHDENTIAFEAEALRDWETYGNGASKQTKDGIATFRNWLKRSGSPNTNGHVVEVEADYPWIPGFEPKDAT